MSAITAESTSEVARNTHTLMGLEADNLQAFLAGLGLLRAIELSDSSLQPRLRWRSNGFVPELCLTHELAASELVDIANMGILQLAEAHEFDRPNIKFTREEFRQVALVAQSDPMRGSLVAALASDGVLKRDSDEVVATPLCAQFGQGHQSFLDRLAAVPRTDDDYESELYDALFQPWRYGGDSRKSFRWDPVEDRRHAYQFGDPSKSRNQIGTQPGAARLAAVGFSMLTSAPVGGELGTIGVTDKRGQKHVCWPLTGVPISSAGLTYLLAHPALGNESEAISLRAYGVTAVCRSRRYRSGDYFNFERAQVQVLSGELGETAAVYPSLSW
jgi:hypothetical protein